MMKWKRSLGLLVAVLAGVCSWLKWSATVGEALGATLGTSRYQRYSSSVHARRNFFSSSTEPFLSSVPARGLAQRLASSADDWGLPPHAAASRETRAMRKLRIFPAYTKRALRGMPSALVRSLDGHSAPAAGADPPTCPRWIFAAPSKRARTRAVSARRHWSQSDSLLSAKH